jgi:hypothetical protein
MIGVKPSLGSYPETLYDVLYSEEKQRTFRISKRIVRRLEQQVRIQRVQKKYEGFQGVCQVQQVPLQCHLVDWCVSPDLAPS